MRDTVIRQLAREPHALTHDILLGVLTGGFARGGQCNFGKRKPLLSHILTREDTAGRRPFVSQSAQGDGSRFASYPAGTSTLGISRPQDPCAGRGDAALAEHRWREPVHVD